ncbi:tetratricopeptide repeat protein [Paludibaculum fermentans]|uniref:Tetratricopeptide repeat protein n=1 Tax=Paludibaculum fermentans TaxID=1473598 RepID=A0A7S7NV45_PALFE|nr:tetratricopeptide repeat protein [Paludibaculum fermentans]QOY90296.1 tetratricopeptide repeat protein [Paludibaculum fermentans]
MKHSRLVLQFLTLLVALLSLGGCMRDPEKVKRRYLENGNKYMAQGKYKEAALMYRNAIRRDQKFGEAYAQLGDAELRRGDVRAAVGAYRRAVELLPNSEESAGKLADIYLAAYSMQKDRNSPLLNEVRDLAETLLKKDANSYHGLRLRGFMAVSESKSAEAIEYFRKADAVRPKQPELIFALAQLLTQDNQWLEAEKLAQKIVQDTPHYVPVYDFLALQYLRRQQPAEAEATVLKKVANNPTVVEFKLQLAGFYRGMQKKDQSEQIIQKVMADNPNDPAVFRKVGDFFVRLRELDRATQVYTDSLKRFPAEKTSFRLRAAQVKVAQGKPQDALAIVEEALAEDPKSNDALTLRASLQLQYGGKEKQQAAINDLQTLLSRTPSNAVVRYNLARAYHSRGDLDAARVQYLEAIKLAPTFAASHLGLGQVYLAKRDFGKAIGEADEALKADPANAAARVIRINALTNSGNLAQARTDSAAYLKEKPDSPDLQFQVAVIDFIDGHLKEAEATFRSLRSRFQSDPRLTFAIAEVMIRTNRQTEALKFLQDELTKSPNNAELRLAVANTALRIGQGDVAEAEYRQLVDKDPKNTDLYMRLGETLRKKGQIQASIEVLKKGQQLAPTNPAANLQLALTLDIAGMKRESLPLYEAVVKVDPDNAVALNNLAFMYAEDGKDLDQALTYAQRAKAKLPNNEDVADTMAWIYIKKQLNDNAITILKDLTSRQPKNPTYHHHMGVALFQKGNKAAAKQSLQTALSLKPAKDEENKIRELLAKVG